MTAVKDFKNPCNPDDNFSWKFKKISKKFQKNSQKFKKVSCF